MCHLVRAQCPNQCGWTSQELDREGGGCHPPDQAGSLPSFPTSSHQSLVCIVTIQLFSHVITPKSDYCLSLRPFHQVTDSCLVNLWLWWRCQLMSLMCSPIQYSLQCWSWSLKRDFLAEFSWDYEVETWSKFGNFMFGRDFEAEGWSWLVVETQLFLWKHWSFGSVVCLWQCFEYTCSCTVQNGLQQQLALLLRWMGWYS